MKKIPDIINRLWNVCGQMEVGTLLTCGSGIITVTASRNTGRKSGGSHPTPRRFVGVAHSPTCSPETTDNPLLL